MCRPSGAVEGHMTNDDAWLWEEWCRRGFGEGREHLHFRADAPADPGDEFDRWCEANPEDAAALFAELGPIPGEL